MGGVFGYHSGKENRKTKRRRMNFKRRPSTDLFRAVRADDLKGLKSFIRSAKDHSDLNINQFVNNTGSTLLKEACLWECIDIVRYLLDLKADVNALDMNGATALHYSCLKHSNEIARLLIDSKAFIHSSTSFGGLTPLLWACEAGSLPLVKLLLERKANIETVNSFGYGPLHFAAMSGNLSTVKYLVEEAKIDIKAVDKFTNTPFDVANDWQVQDYLQAQIA
ncbi:hypothetical protein AAMO2058_001315200, partial [Amorphochlora amoebiformis]